VEWSLVGLSLLFIALRGYVRFMKRQNPILSDYLVVLAWFAFVAYCACNIALHECGLFDSGKTYEMELSEIGDNSDDTVEALKVPFPSDKC
jgi:hypothetical protein